MHPVRRVVVAATAMLAAVCGVGLPGTAVSSASTARCAEAVVVPIRGSGDGAVGARTYGDVHTDGWEGATLSLLMRTAYDDHPDIADVPVLSVGSGYAAIGTEQGIRTRGFGRSVQSGVRTAIAAYDDYRADHGARCAPQMVLLGFSQGAAVAREVALRLADEDVVSAVLLMGDPLQKAGADGVMGTGSDGTGAWRNPVGALVSGVDTAGIDDFYAIPGIRRMSVCHHRDPVCDFGIGADLRGRPHTTYLGDETPFHTTRSAPAIGTDELAVLAATLRADILWATEQATPAPRTLTV